MVSKTAHPRRHKVAVIGSGNWGSAIAKIAAENTKQHSNVFEEMVTMWVLEEEVETKDTQHGETFENKAVKLHDVINQVHENIKYLPGITLPDNIFANPSVEDTVKNASILIFNLPQKFVLKTCDQIKGHHLPYARAISCIKGINVSGDEVSLYSELIMEKLGIYCGTLSGANLAPEVAAEKWCETTIGYDVPPLDLKPSRSDPSSKTGFEIQEQQQASRKKKPSVILHNVPEDYPPVDYELLTQLFNRPYFDTRIVKDAAGVALCGALKNPIALAVGFVAGAGFGENAKAAILRIGLLEMLKFGESLFPDSVSPHTFTRQSAGIADLVASCFAGRNYRSAKAAAERNVSIHEIEKTDLNGQTLEGPPTAQAIYDFLEKTGQLDEFPLFTAIETVIEGKAEAKDIPSLIKKKRSKP